MLSTKTKKAQRAQESLGLRAKAPVAAQFEDCFQFLVQLSDALQANRPDCEELFDLSRQCRTRFKAWGGDSGASSRTLDYALKNSPRMMRQIHGFLTDLRSTLEQAIAEVRPQVFDHEDRIQQLATQKLNETGDTEKEAATDENDIESDPVMYLDEALDIIGCLIKLLPALREPVGEDIPDRAVIEEQDEYSTQFYQELAITKFPEASTTLVERLAESTWRARQNLLYLRDKANNPLELPGSGLPIQTDLMPGESSKRRRQRRQRRTATYQPSSTQYHSTRGADSDAGTSTARSTIDTVLTRTHNPEQSSMTSVDESQLSSRLQQIPPRLVLPEPPVPLGGANGFKCPWCHFELPLTMATNSISMDEWKDHVYLDLQPYICTFGHCSRDNRPFGSKEKWFQHELDFHRSPMTWYCGVCASYADTEDDFQTHLKEVHVDLAPHALAPILEACRRYSKKPLFAQSCPFCHAMISGMDELKNHLGGHLETFAIAATLDLDQPDEDNLERDEFVEEFVDEQLVLHGPSDAPSLPDVKSGPTTLARKKINTNASRAVETSDASNLNEPDPAMRREENDMWTERVQTFLEKQTSQDQVQTKWSNAPARYDAFCGRDHDLLQMDVVLSTPGQLCTVTGRGGIGKTAVAIEYIYRYDTSYSYIFWVDAETPGGCAEQYAMIASILDTGENTLRDEGSRVYFVKECLAKTESQWLLIFDNVGSWADVALYIPRNLAWSKGSVLITTREGPLHSVPLRYHQKTIELKALCSDHGREFLLLSLEPTLAREDMQSHPEFGLAGQVVRLLACLPLALSIAVGYIKTARCTLAEFLEMWEEKASRNKDKKVQEATGKDGVDSIIDSLWEISIREVNLNCRRLLDTLSFFDPMCIQKSLLVGDHEKPYLEFLNARETVSYRRMIDRLHSRRLIRTKDSENDEQIYSMHRMLQEKIQLDMEDYAFADAFRKAFGLIRKRCPRAEPTQVPVPENWDLCKMYMPHVYSFHRIYQKNAQVAQLADPSPVEVAELFYDAGFHVWARQTSAYDGLSFLETADQILDRIGMDPDEKLRADIDCIMGLLLLNMGCVERAQGEKRLKVAMHIREKIWNEQPDLKENDIMYRNSATDYSLCLLNQHQFEEAGQSMIESYERYKMWGPESENPFEYSKYYGNYSIILMWKGRIDEAIAFVERCIRYTEKFSGQNAQYYRRLFLLGCHLLQSGDVQGALDKHLVTLTGRLELHGKHHTATILSMYAVGAMYHHLGHAVTATDYMKQCIECVKNAKWTDEALARAQYHLSVLYEEQGIEEDSAKRLREKALRVLDRYRQYAGECVRDSGDVMMIFDDLQPTFLGRYTGRTLLKRLQEYHK